MNFGFRAIFSCFSFCLFLSICLVMLDVKWRELAPSNSVSLEVLESSRSFETSSQMGWKARPNFIDLHQNGLDWWGFFLSHYGFRARPINGELIGFMCRSLNQKNVPWSLRPIRDCLIIECFLEVKIPKYSNWDIFSWHRWEFSNLEFHT